MTGSSRIIGRQAHIDIDKLTQIITGLCCSLLRQAVEAIRQHIHLFAISCISTMIKYGIGQPRVSVGVWIRLVHFLSFFHIIRVYQVLCRTVTTLSTFQANGEVQFLQFVGITYSFNQNHLCSLEVVRPQQLVERNQR